MIKNYNILKKPDSASEGAFCGKLLSCADKIKLAHFAVKGTGSYAKHTALGDLYNSFTDLTDEIVELIQGYKGILNISVPASSLTEALGYLKTERTEIITFMNTCSSMPDVQNKIQELIGEISRCIYKLENLQ